MHYTLHQLQVFLKVAELGSVSKAAEALHLTQPAVSMQLRKLQEQFALPLTEIVGRQLYLTEFGQEIATAARPILEQVHAINYKTLAYQGQLTGQLRIMSVSTGKYIMPYLLSDFLYRNPGIELQYQVTNKQQVLEALEQNIIDLALVSLVPAHLALEKLELVPNELRLVASPLLLERAQTNGWQELLERQPLLFRESGSGTRQLMEAWLQGRGWSQPHRFELGSNEAIKQAVLAGLGCSVMPLLGIKGEVQRGEMVVVEAPGLPLFSQWSLVYARGKRLLPAAKAFLSFLERERDTISSKWFS
ncbi:MAG: LysR family transcriptional regulator [Sphingobacteriaceae bacterium]|nr:LysR family transcriptional regulator [Sphingobacteriaceae bacterium]